MHGSPARSTIPRSRTSTPKPRSLPTNGNGKLHKAEKAAIAAIVAAVPREMNAREERALGIAMGRSPELIHKTISEVRAKFADNAEHYVDLHLKAAKAAEVDGDYEVATKAAQWALTNVSKDGERVIDTPDAGGSQASKVVIGIQLGGLGIPTATASAKLLPVVDISPSLDHLGD